MHKDSGTTRQVTIDNDKIVDFLLHAATREDIANLDNKIDNKIAALDSKIDSNFRWILTTIVATSGVITGVILAAIKLL